jgi:tetratricopeptide (TPR) repeat protein
MKPEIHAALTALVVATLTIVAPMRAAQSVLAVHVSDVKGQPMSRVQLATKGDGGVGPPTDTAGRTRIALAPQTKPQTIVALTIVAPSDVVFISPWDSQVRVPPFENESQNFAAVVLAQRGERALLENGKVVSSVVARMNLSTSAKDGSRQPPVRPTDALTEAAAMLGLPPSDVDAAIRAWQAQTTDPYEKGMVSLYTGNLADSTAKLVDALAQRERAPSGPRDAADAAFFLGQVLYRQGRYADAAAMYRRALGHRPGDPATTNNLALTLLQAGDYAGAEPLLRLAITTIEAARGQNDPDVVYALNNLGAMLVVKGDVAGAETAFRRGLQIRTTTLGTRDVRTANSMTNLASALLARGADQEAEKLLATALDIFDAAPPVPQPLVPGAQPMSQRTVVVGGALGTPGRASVRLNQAILARHRGLLAESKTIAQEVLRDQTQTYGPRNAETANATIVLAQTELVAGDASAAVTHFENAVDMLQSILDVRHPTLADPLVGVGDAAVRLRDSAKADAAYRRAAAIRRSSFGSDDAMAADIAKKLAALGR